MNISIFLIAIIWAYLYNSFFGWNWNSQSFEELICDGIFAILVSLSILRWVKPAKRIYRGLAYQYNYNIKEKYEKQHKTI